MTSRYDTATGHLDPPLALADLDAFDANAAELRGRAAGRPIRVVSKSLRCRFLLERALATDGYSGVMAYSLAEALWLCRAGSSSDLLVGYPCVDRALLRELAGDAPARRSITLMVDSVEHLDFIDAVLGARHPELRVCLELDASWRPLRGPWPHLGVRRSPIRTARQARALAERIVARPGFRLVGLMSYEAQIAGMGDAPAGKPLLGAVLRAAQRRSAAELARRRAAVVHAVRQVADLEFVNGGGTGSVHSTAAEDAITEVAAGSGLVGPGLFDGYRRFAPRPAVLFALPVVRRPTRRHATLFSGGYQASGPPQPSRTPVLAAPAGLALVPAEGAGEVQTPVTGPGAGRLRLGDRVWLRHAKGGELAERFAEYHLLAGGELVGSAPTYRGEQRCFG